MIGHENRTRDPEITVRDVDSRVFATCKRRESRLESRRPVVILTSREIDN